MNTHDILSQKSAALAEAEAATDLAALEATRVKFLGRSGLLPQIMAAIKDVPGPEKKDYGQTANAFRIEIQTAVDARREILAALAEAGKVASFDYTLPGQWPRLGSKHPITQIIERATGIFRSLGFSIADGPDIETPFNNFDALNVPPEHPSRADQDTFYLDQKSPHESLLRTHTSPVQIRVMQSRPPPLRIIAPGRCYRRDTTDATHSANFHQIEGLYVDRKVSLADLKGDITYFAKQLMGADVKVRFRTHFFPFTEPSVEYDFSCHVCGGKGSTAGAGCRVCKHSGWIEISGAGLVNPKVLGLVGLDPEHWQGYAFGMGVERIAMILYGIPDIRHLYDNDTRFLAQF